MLMPGEMVSPVQLVAACAGAANMLNGRMLLASPIASAIENLLAAFCLGCIPTLPFLQWGFVSHHRHLLHRS
jgi:hypothetical protein